MPKIRNLPTPAWRVRCCVLVGDLGPLAFYSHWPIFTTLGEMTDADKVMNTQHFGSHPDPNTNEFRNLESNPGSLSVKVRLMDCR